MRPRRQRRSGWGACLPVCRSALMPPLASITRRCSRGSTPAPREQRQPRSKAFFERTRRARRSAPHCRLTWCAPASSHRGQGPSARCSAVSGGVRLSISGVLAASRLENWRAGRLVRVTAVLRPPAFYLDPGVRDERRALARRGIMLVGSVKSGALVDVVSAGSRVSEIAASCRAWTRRAIASLDRPVERAIGGHRRRHSARRPYGPGRRRRAEATERWDVSRHRHFGRQHCDSDHVAARRDARAACAAAREGNPHDRQPARLPPGRGVGVIGRTSHRCGGDLPDGPHPRSACVGAERPGGCRSARSGRFSDDVARPWVPPVVRRHARASS